MLLDDSRQAPSGAPGENPYGQQQAGGMNGKEKKGRDGNGEYFCPPAEEAQVKLWLKRIRNAEIKWEPDFAMMRRCMEFVRGLQWEGQVNLEDQRYVNNVTLKLVNQKVATLYARNPEAEVLRRKRRDFQVWDETQGMLMTGVQAAMMAQQTGQMVQPEVMALLADYQQGKSHQKMVDNVCDTLKKLYEYEVDQARPDFKEQAKSLVRRTITCGVGYIRPNYIDDSDPRPSELSTVETRHALIDRAKRAKQIIEKYEKEEINDESAEVEQLKSLFLSMGVTMQTGEEGHLTQRLEFDFPPATSVIPDERCRNLKDFVAARFVAIKYNLPLEEVNEFFGTDIKYSEMMKESDTGQQPKEIKDPEGSDKDDLMKKPKVVIYEVLDYTSKTHFYVCKGWKSYVLEPEPLTPAVSGFWNIFALTFNDVESDDCTQQRTSIFPPSDVFLVMHPQRERNRSRDALRDQRVGNAPMTLVRGGYLTPEDKIKLENRTPNSIIELNGIPPDVKPSEFLMPVEHAAIDPRLYDTSPVQEDMQLATGVQEANVGPAQPRVTATVGTIAEQSRMTVSSSNIDDLDGVLSRVARASIEMLLRAMPKEQVVKIVGPGAVWPEQSGEDFLNLIEMGVKASSSGRPNKAVETANFRELAPILQASGANPIALIEEGVKRMDDRLDVQKFFPVPGMMGLPAGGVGSPPSGQPQGPANVAPASPPGVVPEGGAPVPLAAA